MSNETCDKGIKMTHCADCGHWFIHETKCPKCQSLNISMFSCKEGMDEINKEIKWLTRMAYKIEL